MGAIGRMMITVVLAAVLTTLMSGAVLAQGLDDSLDGAPGRSSGGIPGGDGPDDGGDAAPGRSAAGVGPDARRARQFPFAFWLKGLFNDTPDLLGGLDQLLAGLDQLLRWLVPGFGGMPASPGESRPSPDLVPGVEPLRPPPGRAGGAVTGTRVGAGTATGVGVGAGGRTGAPPPSGIHTGTGRGAGTGTTGSTRTGVVGGTSTGVAGGTGSGRVSGAGGTTTATATGGGSATTGTAGASGDFLSRCPPRPADAETGSAFLARTDRMSRAEREEAVLQEILRGNVPDFMRQFREVPVRMRLADGREHTAVFKALPDYLCIGSNADFVRMPMSPITAQRIAERFGCLLPTKTMVDHIYAAAETRLNPQPMSGGQYPNWQSRMMKNEFYGEHQRLVESQRARSGHQLGQLVAGHKKDVIIGNALNQHPRQVLIYGWHDRRNGGRAIQPRSWIHENTYADYSHGVRLVAGTMTVDGREMSVADVMRDPVLCRLLSDEGPMTNLSACR